MGPKKRGALDGAAPAKRTARVRCPACEKEVPYFFVNSHMDLECSVLKPAQSPGPPLPSVGPPIFGTCRPETMPKDGVLDKKVEDNKSNPRNLSSELNRGTFEGSQKLSIDEEDDLGKVQTEQRRRAPVDGAGPSDEVQELCSGRDYPAEELSSWSSARGQEEKGRERDVPKSCQSYPRSARNDDGGANLSVKTWFDTSVDCHSVEHALGESRRQNAVPTCEFALSTAQPVQHGTYRSEEASHWKKTLSYLAASSQRVSTSSPLRSKAPSGLHVVENFITSEEEEHLLHCLDTDVSNPWKLSRVNGIHHGKSYGCHIFGDSKRRVVSQVSAPMPNFVLPYIDRMRNRVPALKEFFPNEMNSIDYRKGDGHYLKSHMDDRQLSGTVLVNLSLAGACLMTYSREQGLKDAYRVKLERRSLQVLTGQSRYNYKHGIEKDAILDPRRVSMTFRQSVQTSKNL